MTKTTSVFAGTFIALAVLLIFAFVVSAYADTRDSRDRGSTGRTIEPAPTPPSTAPVSTPTPPPPTGGITNVTQGSVSSGGNTGGNVVTGDESIEVVVVNIGPTNNPPPAPEPTPAPAPTPEPECDRRAVGCATPDLGRTR